MTKKLFYIANARMPTEKAHGVAIAKACEAFASAGVETALILPMRRTPIRKSIYDAYGVKRNFAVNFLPTIDILKENSGPLIFWLQTLTFQLSLIFFLLFKDRRTTLYSRDPGMIALRFLGFKVVFECHLISKNRNAFFSLARRADKIVVISRELKKAFIDSGFEESSILVAPSGVDLSIFDIPIDKENARKELELPLHGFMALYTGNFTTMGEDKGIRDIILALASVKEILFVAAGGSEKDRDLYAKEADDVGVSDRVILRGTTTQQVLAKYQKASDILLMPFPDTPHYRNHMSPVKMFEYMVAKRPIIASDLPTIREVLNENNAIIVPPGDVRAIAKALMQVAEHTDTYDVLAEKAYTDVSQYSWQARTARVLAHIGL